MRVEASSTELLCSYIIHTDNTKIFNYLSKVSSPQRAEVPLYQGSLPYVLLLLG